MIDYIKFSDEKGVEYIIEVENGLISAKGIMEQGIKKWRIAKLVEERLLEKRGMGMYSVPGAEIDNYVFIEKKLKTSRFSHLTGLYLYGMIDEPKVIQATLPLDNSRPITQNNLSNKIMPCKLYYTKKIEEYNEDRIVTTKNGYIVTTYSPEMCVCLIIREMFKHHKEELYEGYNKECRAALKTYFEKYYDERIFEVSKHFNIDKELRNYYEMIVD